MMKGLNLSFGQGKGELVVSSLLLGGKPSRPIGNTVEVRAEGGEREEEEKVYLAWIVMSQARGPPGPGICISQSVCATHLFPFVSAGALPVLGAGSAF